MKNIRAVLVTCWAFTGLSAIGQIPPGYYDNAEGLTGPALKSALFGIISAHDVQSYSQLWGHFQSTDARPDGKVWDIYSDRPDSISPYSFTFGTDQCGNYNGEGDCYNREHSVPQDWFNSASPMLTDLFHVYPTDGWVNNKRGSLPYAEVGSTAWTGLNGSKTGYSITPGYQYTVFEPIDPFKGDLARTYFYMMTRYMPDVSSWTSPMFSTGDLSAWARNMMIAWSDGDPVSQKEIDRNNAIYQIQDNRNPFIDHPEWIHSIWTSTVGVEESRSNADRLWIANGELFRSNSSTAAVVEVFGSDGRKLLGDVFLGTRFQLPAMSAGVYLARVGTVTLRFVR
ncbi:MAG: endonuclease [Flavobacteriales bacterium]|nr:endonuclease [Flavobacteriales bacterium]